MTLLDWEQRKLGDVVKAKSGWSPSEFKIDRYQGILFIKVDDLNNSQREQDTSKWHVYENRNYPKIKKLSTIFPKRGAAILTNKVRILSQDCYMDTNIMALEPEKIEPDFLYSFIEQTGLFKIADTSTIPQINNKHINPYKLWIPYYSEQKKIANLLKIVDNIITLQQRKLNTLFQYKSQFVNDIFEKQNSNWKTKRLNEFLHVPAPEISNVTTKEQIMTVKLNVGGVVSGASRDTLKLSATKYYVRHAGQLIFGKQNFFNGSIAIVPQNMDGKVTSQDVPSLNIDKDKIDSYFLLYYLSQKNFYKHTERFATGTGSKRLHVETLLNLKIKVPSIKMQKKLSSVISKINADIRAELKKLNMYKKIKQSLLQNMFI